MKTTFIVGPFLIAVLILSRCPARAEQGRDEVAAPAGTIVQKLHAVGVQIYECKADAQGHLAWTFREPLASLMREGRTVGRHFVGPTWEMADGSRIVGKVVGQAAAPASGDIPWLRLEVSDRKGPGDLDGVTVVQRVETSGGRKSGPCPAMGALWAEPYAAEYLFSRP